MFIEQLKSVLTFHREVETKTLPKPEKWDHSNEMIVPYRTFEINISFVEWLNLTKEGQNTFPSNPFVLAVYRKKYINGHLIWALIDYK